MLKEIKDPAEMRQMLMALLATAGTLAGIALTLVGIVKLSSHAAKIETLADDLFLFSAIGFVIICYFAFFALRYVNSPVIKRVSNFLDVLFLVSLTLLMFAGFVTVYAFM